GGRGLASPRGERFPPVAAFVGAAPGQPLTLSRGRAPPPAVAADSPSALRRAASREAFAQTMGSGDHGDSPVAHAAATAAGAARTAWGPGTAPGAAANAGAAATLPPSTSRSTASAVPGDDRGAPRRRSAGT